MCEELPGSLFYKFVALLLPLLPVDGIMAFLVS